MPSADVREICTCVVWCVFWITLNWGSPWKAHVLKSIRAAQEDKDA